MKTLNEKVAVVTGAGSGIGRALAQGLAAKGCRLVLTDIRMDSLKETRDAIDLPDNDVLCHEFDVSDCESMETLASMTVDHFGQVDILINNAGITSVGDFEDQTLETMHRVFDVNVWGVVHGCLAFLPHLRERPEAALVNVSSINGMVPFPENGPYNMSKYAVLGLNETLLMELKGSTVQLLSVHPGFIKTNIANFAIDGAKEKQDAFAKFARTSPEQAARKIIKAIKSGQSHVYVGADAKMLQLLKRINANAALGLSDMLVRGLGRRL